MIFSLGEDDSHQQSVILMWMLDKSRLYFLLVKMRFLTVPWCHHCAMCSGMVSSVIVVSDQGSLYVSSICWMS